MVGDCAVPVVRHRQIHTHVDSGAVESGYPFQLTPSDPSRLRARRSLGPPNDLHFHVDRRGATCSWTLSSH